MEEVEVVNGQVTKDQCQPLVLQLTVLPTPPAPFYHTITRPFPLTPHQATIVICEFVQEALLICTVLYFQYSRYALCASWLNYCFILFPQPERVAMLLSAYTTWFRRSVREPVESKHTSPNLSHHLLIFLMLVCRHISSVVISPYNPLLESTFHRLIFGLHSCTAVIKISTVYVLGLEKCCAVWR